MERHSPDGGPRPLRLTDGDYLLLDAAGAFQGYAGTELIDGTILAMNPAQSRHARVHSALFLALADAGRAAKADWQVLIEASVRVDANNVPQPDLAVMRDLPADGVVPVAALLLAVEVADSSRDFDLGPKARLYAGAGVPEYWVADTTTGLLRQHWRPVDGRYVEMCEQAFGTTLSAATLALTVALPLA